MASTNLAEYISSVLAKGFSEAQIASKLKSSGYSDPQIKEALDAAKGKSIGKPAGTPQNKAEVKTPPAQKPKAAPGRLKPIHIAGIVLLAILFLALVLYSILYFAPLGKYKTFTIIDATSCKGAETFEIYQYCSMNQSPRIDIESLADCGLVNDTQVNLFCTAIISGKQEDCAGAVSIDYCHSLQVRSRSSRLKCITVQDLGSIKNCLATFGRTEKMSQYNDYLFLFSS